MIIMYYKNIFQFEKDNAALIFCCVMIMIAFNNSILFPHYVIAVQEKPKHPYATQIAKAFDTSYHLLDILLSYGKDEWSKVRWSGTSALTVIIESTSGSEETTKTVSEKQIMSLASLETKQEELVNETAKRRQYDPPQEIGYIHLANAGKLFKMIFTNLCLVIFPSFTFLRFLGK